MRILLITPYFAPYNNPRSLRWTQIVEEWAQQGNVVDIVTGKHPPELPYGQIDQLHIYHPAFPSPAARRPAIDSTSSPYLSTLRKLYRFFFKNWMWPDDSKVWQQPAFRTALDLIGKHQYDALITVSLPFSAHCVGSKIHQLHPEIPWLVDVGDPFALQENHRLNNSWLFGQRNRKAEYQVLSQADRVVCTNNGCRNLYLRTFPTLNSEKVLVIPPTSGLAQVDNQADRLTGPLRIGYFGRFSQGVREPESFLLNLKQLQAVSPSEWHFYGDTIGLLSAALRHQPAMSRYVFQHPLLDSKQLDAVLQDIDILLSLGISVEQE